MIKTIRIKGKGLSGEYNIAFRLAEYENGNTAVIMDCFTDDEIYDGVFGKLTVNLGDELPEGYGYIDVNNLGDQITDWIMENDLGEFTGMSAETVFVKYPLYKLNMAKIKEYQRP